MLEQCNEHEFHDLQFGFVPNRSTTMAAALTYDVFNYCVSRGSPVYICSLDAESAFDGIPHCVLFSKAMGNIPIMYWRMLIYWYMNLVVQIKWNNELSGIIMIHKGTRQGGLSSPFLFNLMYQDIVNELSDMNVGISINNTTYNTFCYADDLLLCSLTISGLQKLIDRAHEQIIRCGLNFNPLKTQCMTFGKSVFNTRSWNLNNIALCETDSIRYLGVMLSNNDSKHCEERVNATRRAYYALQNVGMCSRGVKPDTVVHIYNTAIRPVLMYGQQCIFSNKTAIDRAEKLQAKLLKCSLGLKSYSKTTPLLKALKIPRINSTIQMQEIKFLRNMIVSSSRTQDFYNYVLYLHLKGIRFSKKCLVTRVLQTCANKNISLVKALCDKSYLHSNKHLFIQCTDNDGFIDSLRYLLQDFNDDSLHMMQLLLMSF